MEKQERHREYLMKDILEKRHLVGPGRRRWGRGGKIKMDLGI